ncbi:MAG: hypothetical protein QGG36_32265 [Pirellulaceae bacterium]|jgi:hypothetical protein|nr:hypothetical protein [Pirellulaceae bacterium]
MLPLVSIRLETDSPELLFQPNDSLRCAYQIDAVEADQIQAVEASVLWYTEGKGDEDLGVHYFERRTPTDTIDGDLRQLRQIETRLPPSPLSYAGVIVKIRWCVRIRLFLRGGEKTYLEELVFHLGGAVPNLSTVGSS